MPHKIEEYNNNPNEWKTSMMNSCCSSPAFCAFACVCPCIPMWQQRMAIIGENGKYQCCLGYFPCLTMECPVPCYCCEMFCCPGIAASVNRMFVMSALQIKPDPCDQCIICCSNIMQIVACLARIFCSQQLADALDCVADLVFCSVLACMQTQTQFEIEQNPQTLGQWPTIQQNEFGPKKQNMV